MGKAKVVAIGLGIASLVIGILGAYLIYQESAESDYVNGANRIVSDRNKIINEFMSDLLPRLETKQIGRASCRERV